MTARAVEFRAVIDRPYRVRKSSNARLKSCGFSRLLKCPESAICTNREPAMRIGHGTGFFHPDNRITLTCHDHGGAIRRGAAPLKNPRGRAWPLRHKSRRRASAESIIPRTFPTISEGAFGLKSLGSIRSDRIAAPCRWIPAIISLRAAFSVSLSARARVLESTSRSTRPGYFDRKAKAMYPPIDTPATVQLSTRKLPSNAFRSSPISSMVHGEAGCEPPNPRRSGAMTRNCFDKTEICGSHI